MSSAYRLTPQVSATAPADPTTPASEPSTPYSTSSIVAILRVFAPSVLNTAASYTRWNFVIATAPTRISPPLKSTRHADDGDGQRHFRHDVADGFQNLVEIDHRHVRKARDEIVLKPGARRRA